MRLRSREQRSSVFDADKVKFDAKYGGSLRHFSLWAIEEHKGRRVTAICQIDDKDTKLLGFEADGQSFKTVAASSGWFVGTFEGLDQLPAPELDKIWSAGHSPKFHPIWSRL